MTLTVPSTSPSSARPATRQRRRFVAREPQVRFADTDRRTKRFLAGSVVTLVAVVLVVSYLLPFGFMTVTALKTEEQLANGRTLPMSQQTTTIDGTEYPVLDVPFDDGSRSLALVKPGRKESTFVDPAAPDTEIVWEGNWRTLPASYNLDPKFENFTSAWDKLGFLRLIRNTMIIAGIGMAGTIIASTLVAYGLSRFRIRFKGLILGTLLATIILPRFVTLVPTYVIFDKLNWIGTFLPLTVPHFFGSAYNVFLLRQFFLTIPRDLDEAASIDGAGPLRTLVTVILPQAKGAILAVALFHFFYAWNDFLEPLIYLQGNADRVPIAVGLFQFTGLYDSDITLIQAGALISMAIPILVFVFLQRIFLRGIDLSGSLK
jgi:multiple sugar transport system permease protein